MVKTNQKLRLAAFRSLLMLCVGVVLLRLIVDSSHQVNKISARPPLPTIRPGFIHPGIDIKPARAVSDTDYVYSTPCRVCDVCRASTTDS